MGQYKVDPLVLEVNHSRGEERVKLCSLNPEERSKIYTQFRPSDYIVSLHPKAVEGRQKKTGKRCLYFHFFDSPTLTMSRSHSHSHDSGHARGSRRRATSTLAVTEASFQGLQLNETAGTHHSASYTASDPTYPRSSSRRGELTANYLQPGYELGDFVPVPPSETFVDPQRVFGDYRSSGSQRLDFLDPGPADLGLRQASAENMRYICQSLALESYLIKIVKHLPVLSRPDFESISCAKLLQRLKVIVHAE